MSHPNKAHAELIAGLKIGTKILEDFVSGIPETQMHRRRREGFWSLYEHLEHLAIVQLMLYKRLERFLKEERPEFVPYFPDEQEEKKEKINKLEILVRHILLHDSFHLYRMEELWLSKDEYLAEM